MSVENSESQPIQRQEPVAPMTPEEVQAEASRLAHERIAGLEPIDFGGAREALADQEVVQQEKVAAALAKRERMEEMDKWSRAQGKITRERAVAAKRAEQVAKEKVAGSTTQDEIDKAEMDFRRRNEEISSMQHEVGATMNSTIYGTPTKEGDILRHEVSDMGSNRVFGEGRSGSRSTLRSPANIKIDKKEETSDVSETKVA